MKFRQNKTFIIILFALICTSCNAGNPLQKEFGADSDYFIGLTQLKNGQENEARTKFLKCIKKGSPQCVRKSYETLCTFGTVQEKNQAAINYAQKYQDSDAILLAVRQLKSAGEISKIIELTENCNLTEEYNEIIKIRMEALKQRGDSSFEAEVFNWFMNRPISGEHYQFFRDSYDIPEYEVSGTEANLTPEQFAIAYRIELYKRNYSYTFPAVTQMLEYFNSGLLEAKEQLASDIGKACLYGSTDFAKNAELFYKLAEEYKGTPLEYYMWFYTGRLFEKATLFYRQSKSSFEAAVRTASNSSQKDNALWYLLVSSLNFSLETITEDIENCSRQWDNPEYFEDFFESLISSLLASGKWNAFGEICKLIDGYATDLTTAQYAYLYGRLIQEKLASGTKEDEEAAFRRALSSGSAPYYKVMAAYQLGLEGEEIEKILTAPFHAPAPQNTQNTQSTQPPQNTDPAAERLLKGYAYFGFPELIYPNWQKLYKNGISNETAFFLSNFLNKCAGGTDDYYQQALRIASRSAEKKDSSFTKEELKMLYPHNYSKYIDDFSARYDIPQAIIYAMVRTESFFDHDIQSSAGAIGLTQLMEFTGGDIARKLKVQNYDLTDPETNLQFGTYYLAELIRRCDGSMLQGFFSYNAGITRVRRWVQSSMIEFGKKENMPIDLFLETVPYAETREYGRKLAGASILYEWLYSENQNINFKDIIEKTIR
ncbi:MAG: lytic transglycosylase domain-containing protein [Treponema sp.]|nr:lytic transglycosylase domain-containing protein [Treponema sp.]